MNPDTRSELLRLVLFIAAVVAGAAVGRMTGIDPFITMLACGVVAGWWLRPAS